MIKVIEKRLAATHIDGENMPGCSAVVRELCIETSHLFGFRWVIRDSVRDGGDMGDRGEWASTEAEAMESIPWS